MNLESMDLFANFTWAGFIADLLFGTVGFWIFQQSRKKLNIKLSIIGVALMMFPLFISNPWGEWLTGLGLCGAAYWVWNDD